MTTSDEMTPAADESEPAPALSDADESEPALATPHAGTGADREGYLPPAAPSFRVMEVASLAVQLPDQYPMLILREAEGQHRSLSFRIGLAEGVALAYALHRVTAPRPLTHDLLATVIQRLGADVIALRLVGRHGTTYLAELDLMGRQHREVISCRPSDGIALALRQPTPAPVMADERLLSGPGDVPPSA